MTNLKFVSNPLNNDPVWKILFSMLYAGIFFIFLSCAHVFYDNRVHFNDYYTAIGSCLLLAGGCFSAGAFIGFMFGIPRILSNPMSVPDDIKNKSNSILQNDNLVQISDWLTKIIVGVGLTQLTNIPRFLNKIGRQLSFSTYGQGQIGINSAIIILIYFTVIGFFFGYLWARIFFPKMLMQVDDIINRKDTELKAFSNTFSPQKEEMKKEMQASIDDIDKVGDPQKNQWGGKLINNQREVTGTIFSSSTDNDLFTVSLEVLSTDNSKPLVGEVIFHLHPSFQQPDRTVIASDGKAKLSFLTTKPFTIGIECDNKSTQLEIDLAKDVKDSPNNFK